MSFSFPYFAAAFLTVQVRDLPSGVELVFCSPSFKLLLSVKVFQSTDFEICFPQNGTEFMEKFLLLEMSFASQNKEAMRWFSFTLCSLQSVGNLLQNINLTGNIITNNKHFFAANFDCKYFFASNTVTKQSKYSRALWSCKKTQVGFELIPKGLQTYAYS